jgi:hypothetical protein
MELCICCIVKIRVIVKFLGYFFFAQVTYLYFHFKLDMHILAYILYTNDLSHIYI